MYVKLRNLSFPRVNGVNILLLGPYPMIVTLFLILRLGYTSINSLLMIN